MNEEAEFRYVNPSYEDQIELNQSILIESLHSFRDTFYSPRQRVHVVTPFGSAVVVYDVLLTCSREFSCIWSRQWSLITLLYAVNRYGAVLELSLRTITTWTLGSSALSCRSLMITMLVVDVLISIAFSAFACLRVWAISSRRWMPCLVVFLLSAFCPAANIYNYGSIVFTMGDKGCSVVTTVTYPYPHHPAIAGPIIVRATVVATDLVLIIVTWYNTSTLRRNIGGLSQGKGVATILFRNGIIQFLVLTLMNVISMILDIWAIGNPDFVQDHATYFIYVAEAVSTIVLSRFILDLRTAYSDETHETYSLGTETIRFAANIGAPLDNSLVLAAGQETQFNSNWDSESTSPRPGGDGIEKFGESHNLKTFTEQA
ncbi:hypothetical protein K474DRAFT_1676582 [Panus rudis PR-1116 ss-1]|nr:hypothetical protein K474DRAFT_1676582 [Panus rudis PR-1116 ss-1]